MTILAAGAGSAPGIRLCLLGTFRLVQSGKTHPVRRGGKAEQLLGNLALSVPHGLPRDQLLELVWPDADAPLARQSLSSLVYWLRRTLSNGLAGRSPIVEHDGRFRLNIDDGVAVDVLQFDAAVDQGDRLTRAGDLVGAMDWYRGAIDLYGGDLVMTSAVQHVIERERLRARYLSVRAHLADHYFAGRDYEHALENALQLLARDPCREDAHRMAMRCYVRLGARAQAVRQYRLCVQILADEFDAPPEGSTVGLYEQVRLDPGRV